MIPLGNHVASIAALLLKALLSQLPVLWMLGGGAVAQGIGSSLCMWDIRTKFPAPGFSFVQPPILKALEGVSSDGRFFSLFQSLSLSVSQINKVQ